MSKSEISNYLAKIGSRGGKKSRRKLDPETARKMQAASVTARKQKKEQS